MSTKKISASILIAIALLVLEVGAAFAAPAQQTTTPTSITGTVNDIVITTDSTGTTIVQVTLTDSTGAQQTYDISVATAASLGLIQVDSSGNPVLDASGNPIPNTSAINTQVTLQPTDILNGGTPTTSVNPVASLLADFFGLNAADVQAMHDDGTGFGVIAQSCFIAQELGNGATCQSVVDAKKSGDFSSFMPAGYTGTVPTNWGQFKKYAFSNSVTQVTKSLTNLGAVVSGRAQKTDTTSIGGATGGASSQAELSNSPDFNSDGPGNGHGKGHGKGNGKGHNK